MLEEVTVSFYKFYDFIYTVKRNGSLWDNCENYRDKNLGQSPLQKEKKVVESFF